LPDCLLKLARYVASFSGALAVLNVVPCYMLDGQHMMEVLMELGLKGTCALRRRRLQTTITLLGKARPCMCNRGSQFLDFLDFQFRTVCN
jgi:hypothetical protein